MCGAVRVVAPCEGGGVDSDRVGVWVCGREGHLMSERVLARAFAVLNQAGKRTSEEDAAIDAMPRRGSGGCGVCALSVRRRRNKKRRVVRGPQSVRLLARRS